jgi:hypothetical protein
MILFFHFRRLDKAIQFLFQVRNRFQATTPVFAGPAEKQTTKTQSKYQVHKDMILFFLGHSEIWRERAVEEIPQKNIFFRDFRDIF